MQSLIIQLGKNEEDSRTETSLKSEALETFLRSMRATIHMEKEPNVLSISIVRR